MLRYCAPFAFLVSIPALYYAAGPIAPLATILVLLTALIGAEWVLPRHRSMGNTARETRRGTQSRLLPLSYVPLQLAVIVWAVWIVSSPAIEVYGFLSLLFSTGIIAGVFAMLAAHALAHSPDRRHRALALAMLMGTCNPQFRIAHIYGHHRFAGTARDAATARLGESFYAFLARTLPLQWKEAFLFEQKRCATRRWRLLNNRALRDVLCLTLLFGALVAWSWRGATFFFAEGLIAIVVLELFNYIAHYGLIRARRADGGLALLDDSHSWNSSNALANLLIFNMGRHSDHHRRPAAVYTCLVQVSEAPELPAGYAGSILMALVPPLWRRVMDQRVLALRTVPVPQLALAA